MKVKNISKKAFLALVAFSSIHSAQAWSPFAGFRQQFSKGKAALAIAVGAITITGWGIVKFLRYKNRQKLPSGPSTDAQNTITYGLVATSSLIKTGESSGSGQSTTTTGTPEGTPQPTTNSGKTPPTTTTSKTTHPSSDLINPPKNQTSDQRQASENIRISSNSTQSLTVKKQIIQRKPLPSSHSAQKSLEEKEEAFSAEMLALQRRLLAEMQKKDQFTMEDLKDIKQKIWKTVEKHFPGEVTGKTKEHLSHGKTKKYLLQLLADFCFKSLEKKVQKNQNNNFDAFACFVDDADSDKLNDVFESRSTFVRTQKKNSVSQKTFLDNHVDALKHIIHCVRTSSSLEDANQQIKTRDYYCESPMPSFSKALENARKALAFESLPQKAYSQSPILDFLESVSTDVSEDELKMLLARTRGRLTPQSLEDAKESLNKAFMCDGKNAPKIAQFILTGILVDDCIQDPNSIAGWEAHFNDEAIDRLQSFFGKYEAEPLKFMLEAMSSPWTSEKKEEVKTKLTLYSQQGSTAALWFCNNYPPLHQQ